MSNKVVKMLIGFFFILATILCLVKFILFPICVYTTLDAKGKCYVYTIHYRLTALVFKASRFSVMHADVNGDDKIDEIYIGSAEWHPIKIAKSFYIDANLDSVYDVKKFNTKNSHMVYAVMTNNIIKKYSVNFGGSLTSISEQVKKDRGFGIFIERRNKYNPNDYKHNLKPHCVFFPVWKGVGKGLRQFD